MDEVKTWKAPWDDLIDFSKYKLRRMEVRVIEYEIVGSRPYKSGLN